MAVIDDTKLSDMHELRKDIINKLKEQVLEEKKKDIEKDPSLKEQIENFFNVETFEIAKDVPKSLGYPKPKGHYRLVWESPTLALEEVYFWFITFFSPSVEKIEKLRDIFSASPQSTFFGSTQQRLGFTQDRITNYLTYIGRMSNEAMTMLRETRAVNERLNYYDRAGKDEKGLPNSYEVTLRDIWTNQVEGGTQNPQSVYGLQTQVGFAILPQLFFTTWFDKEEDIDKIVDKQEIGNPTVKTVLKRKLAQFATWKKETDKELRNKKKFNLTFINQHLAIIRLYVSWLKPYLYYTRAMQMRYQSLERPELISSFENSLAELELLVIPKGKKYKQCVLITLNYISKPEMAYTTPDYQQKGPRHTGQVEINIRSYGWNDTEIGYYKRILQKEDEKLLSFVNAELESALTQVDNYLQEVIGGVQKEQGKEEKKEEKTPEKRQEGPKDPFVSLYDDIAGFVKDPMAAFGNKAKEEAISLIAEKKKAADDADKTAWLAYTIFKKTHRMLAW